MRYAHVKNNSDGVATIVNVVEWDGSAPYRLEEGVTALPLPEAADIGHVWEFDSWRPDALMARKTRMKDQANTVRDEQINGGITFGGVRFQTRPQDRQSITEAAHRALAAVSRGSRPKDYLWDGGAEFVWITEDNSSVALDAYDMAALGRAVADFVTGCVFYARDRKDRIAAASSHEDLDAIEL